MGITRIVGLVLAPHYSSFSIGQYLDRVRAAAAAARHHGGRHRQLGHRARVRAVPGRRPARPAGRHARRHQGAVHRALAAPAHHRRRRPLPRRAARHGRSGGAAGGPARVEPVGDRLAVGGPHARAVARPRHLAGDRRTGRQRASRRATGWVCSCARAASSPTTSRCCTTSTSRRPDAPQRSGLAFDRTACVNDDPAVMAALAATGGRRATVSAHRSARRRRRRRHHRSGRGALAAVVGTGRQLPGDGARGAGPVGRQDPHHPVRRPPGHRRGRPTRSWPASRGPPTSPAPSASATTSSRPRSGSAAVWWDGLQPIPEGLVLGLPTDMLRLARSKLLSWPGKLRAATELVRPRTLDRRRLDRRLRARPVRRPGARATGRPVGRQHLRRRHRPVQPAGGAADWPSWPAASAACCWPPAIARPRPTGPVFYAPDGGMGALVDARRRGGDELGGDIKVGHALPDPRARRRRLARRRPVRRRRGARLPRGAGRPSAGAHRHRRRTTRGDRVRRRRDRHAGRARRGVARTAARA